MQTELQEPVTCQELDSSKLETHFEFIDMLLAQGGPYERDYEMFGAWAEQIGELHASGKLSDETLAQLRGRFGEAISLSTLQGFSFLKPHGYAGDFEIIDMVYRRHVSPEKNLANWDHYFHSISAARAVRNRKQYFHDLLDQCVARASHPITVLNIASGPGRDIYEYLSMRPGANVRFECLEQDADAIAYAGALCHRFSRQVSFTRGNALRFRAQGQYDLVWSAGLFDYFDDRIFKLVLERLMSAVKPGGELVIGNFSDTNPDQPYMRLLGWFLHHRSATHLRRLAEQCGVPGDRITVGQEPEEVNLFLHLHL